MGLLGKPGGMDGSQVEAYFNAGRIQDIADYCRSDVINTLSAYGSGMSFFVVGWTRLSSTSVKGALSAAASPVLRSHFPKLNFRKRIVRGLEIATSAPTDAQRRVYSHRRAHEQQQ
jgi:hypothetical protein